MQTATEVRVGVLVDGALSRPRSLRVIARVTARLIWRLAACVGWLILLAAFLVILVAVCAPAAFAQISPGKLSKAHADLRGPSGCTRCHAVSAGAPSLRCLECHEEIAVRLRNHRGLHPVFMNPADGNAACARCHSEHNGETFSLLRWEPVPGKFDHSKTAFPLDGRHAEIACSRCHNAQRITPAERATIRAKDLNRTYLGLPRACASCHEDKHHGQLGTNCLQCHNTSDWKAAARAFNHSTTKFALTGAHIQVACQRCHAPAADGTLKYVGLRFDGCASCHSDIHRGAFPQQRCESCHTTVTWKKSSFVAGFDHATTKFPLLGRHMEVRCQTCHVKGDFKTPIAHRLCSDCHNPDPHNGQFAKRADGGRCESCHTLEGFKLAKFATAEHSNTRFPLLGAHAAVKCAKCHSPAGKATLYRVKFALCTDCHRDAHRAQFAGAPYANHCEQCHNQKSFVPSSFTLARHQKLSFALTGAHVAVACIDCHRPPTLDSAGHGVAGYHFERLTCSSCHDDPHRGQFAARIQQVDSGGRPVGCEACHSAKSWHDISKFDHDKTRFALTGAHRAVECAACHHPPNLERKLLNVTFKQAPLNCEACHDDVHGAQFARVDAVTRCADCHNNTKWRPALFDHERTAFSLKGGHQSVRCAACHINFRAVNGNKVLFYKPTPKECSACHGTQVAQKAE